MKTIVFNSLKGGTGKSTLSIMLSRCLAASGKKVGVVDLDINDSTTFTLKPVGGGINEIAKSGNMHAAAALQSDDFFSFFIKSRIPGIDLLMSSLYLVDLRTISMLRLRQKIREYGDAHGGKFPYDYLIIDTAGTYDNLVMMAFEAADVIVTPVQLAQFDYNAAIFVSDKLNTETDAADKWHLVFNEFRGPAFYRGGRIYNPDGSDYSIQTQLNYVDLFSASFNNFYETCIQRTDQLKNCIDREMLVNKTKEYERLRRQILSLATEITGEEIDPEGSF